MCLTYIFRDRIMVTLSCLIVLASLFSQLSSNLPDSPEPKAIEVFFFFYILRLSYDFWTHTIIAWLRIYRREKEEKQRQDDFLFDYRPHLFPRKKNPILPKSPEKLCSHFYTEPKPIKYRFSLQKLDCLMNYFGMALEFSFLFCFFAYVMYSRSIVWNSV